jgi:hypothetical protein
MLAEHNKPLSGHAAPEYLDALGTLIDWRSAHSFPLNTVQITLRRKARAFDPNAIIAQRLKRYVSIFAKLHRFKTMKLDTMQDIAGCRAIVADAGTARRLASSYETSPRLRRCLGDRKRDYIAAPKADGYRSIHLVYRFDSESPATSAWNGLQVEIQIRSRLQHAWAAAVETVDLFTRQSMKTGSGIPRWNRFMALMSSAVAAEEAAPHVPDTPDSEVTLYGEIRALHHELDVSRKFETWRKVVANVSAQRTKKDRYFLIEIDLKAPEIKVKAFRASASRVASKEYAAAERRIGSRPDAQVVLAGSSSFEAVEQAFPAYFNDSALFLAVLTRALAKHAAR